MDTSWYLGEGFLLLSGLACNKENIAIIILNIWSANWNVQKKYFVWQIIAVPGKGMWWRQRDGPYYVPISILTLYT